MEQVELVARIRETGKGAARRVRREGGIPATLYGRDTRPISLSVDAKRVERILSEGERNVLLNVKIAGPEGVDTRNAMIKEIQVDHLKRQILHIDLHQVSLNERVRVKVPIVLVGEDEVTERGGIVQHQLGEIEVECLPVDVPDEIAVNVGALNVGDHLTVGDIKPSERVRIVEEPDEIVVTIVAPKAVEEPATPGPAETRSEPEVLKKGKEEDEG